MLIKVKTFKGYKLDSKDGEVGKVKEFYFDDNYWAIRYLVADTGNWLAGQQVLISPYVLTSVNTVSESINIDLNKKQIEDSPSLQSDMPVSRQFENDYFGYYGLPAYWSDANMWGVYSYLVRDRNQWNKSTQHENSWDPNLRSTKDVSGYHIQANDGEIGHVEDFIIDDETWVILYLIIDTTNWFAGKKVLISPKWIDHISWNDSKVFVNLSSEEIRQAPEYSEEDLLTRDYETQLHKYYKRNVYWHEKPEDRKILL